MQHSLEFVLSYKKCFSFIYKYIKTCQYHKETVHRHFKILCLMSSVYRYISAGKIPEVLFLFIAMCNIYLKKLAMNCIINVFCLFIRKITMKLKRHCTYFMFKFVLEGGFHAIVNYLFNVYLFMQCVCWTTISFCIITMINLK